MINRIEELQTQGAHITTEIIGYGFSAGSFFFLLGDERIVHKGAILMFHGAGMQQGFTRMDAKKACNTEGQETLCDVLTMLDDNVFNLLRNKTFMEEKDIQHWMYHEDFNFMSAEEAYKLNVATTIICNEPLIYDKTHS
jgi:ATP-dependent protease ClpP protease subunit